MLMATPSHSVFSIRLKTSVVCISDRGVIDCRVLSLICQWYSLHFLTYNDEWGGGYSSQCEWEPLLYKGFHISSSIDEMSVSTLGMRPMWVLRHLIQWEDGIFWSRVGSWDSKEGKLKTWRNTRRGKNFEYRWWKWQKKIMMKAKEAVPLVVSQRFGLHSFFGLLSFDIPWKWVC